VWRGWIDEFRPVGEQGSTTDGECVAPVNSGDERHTPANYGLRELRRRTTTNGNGTSDERGVLEREANSSRQEWGGSAAFYRMQEGRRKETPGSFIGHRRPSNTINGDVRENNGGGSNGAETVELKLHYSTKRTVGRAGFGLGVARGVAAGIVLAHAGQWLARCRGSAAGRALQRGS
jgi:hypothetical protein